MMLWEGDTAVQIHIVSKMLVLNLTLEMPTGRTSTDLLPCTMLTGALLIGPVHKC